MHGYGEWLQLSVIHCRPNHSRHAEMPGGPSTAIARDDDHVLIVELGVSEQVMPRVQSIGRRGFAATECAPAVCDSASPSAARSWGLRKAVVAL